MYRRSLSARSPQSPRTPAAATRRKLRHSHSDLARSLATLDVSENDRRRAEEDFLAQREATLSHKRRAEQAASRASPTLDMSDDERERAEAEFLAERERVLNDRKRFEELAASRSPSSQSPVSISPRASTTASPSGSGGARSQPSDENDRRSDPATQEDIRAVEEPLLPHGSPPASRDDNLTTSEEVSCEQVLLVYYEHFEPSFATQEKVQKIVQTFRARSENLGEAELFREKMFSAISAQRDVHPLEFFKAHQEASPHKQGRDLDNTPEQTPPAQQQKAKRGFRGRLGLSSKKEDRARKPTQRQAAVSLAVDADRASPFSPRKSLSRTPPSSPPTGDQRSDTSPLVPVIFNSRPLDAGIKPSRVDYPMRSDTIDKAAAAAVRIQAACRGRQVRAEIETTASAPGADSSAVDVGDHHESSSFSEFSASQASDDVALLMEFYREVEPAFATQEKVERIIERFRDRKTSPTKNWRGLMYEAITKQRGIDPRAWVVDAIPLGDAKSTKEPGSTATVSPSERSPASSSVHAWTEQRSTVLLDLASIKLACAQSRLRWARVFQLMLPLYDASPGCMSPLAVTVANALSMAVVVKAAQSLSDECSREIRSLREMKQIDSGARGASSKRQQHYDDVEAAKVMRQVRDEVAVLAKEMSARYQKIKNVSLQEIYESLGRPGDARRRLQPLCGAAVESCAMVAQMRLEKRFNWGLNDGDCVALMEDLLVRVDRSKEESETVQLSRREAAMMGTRRAASMGKGLYEMQRDAAVRCHPGCLSNWVGAVSTGERVRVVKVVSDNSGMLFAKVDEDGLLGWIALGARPCDDEKPVMKRVPQSQLGLATPPSRTNSADESPSVQPREAVKKQEYRETQKKSSKNSSQRVAPRDSRRVDASSSKADARQSTLPVPNSESPAASSQPRSDAGVERWARESTQAERLASLRHELGRDAASSPRTRSLEDKLHALEAQLGNLTSDLQLDSDVGRRHNRDKMRASWSPNATNGSRHTPVADASGKQLRQEVQAVSPDGINGMRCIQESWDTQDVGDWLVSVGLGEYAPAFSGNSMDGEAMLELERWRRRAYHGAQGSNEGSLFADCLRKLGLAKTGHILKLCRYLAESACDAT